MDRHTTFRDPILGPLVFQGVEVDLLRSAELKRLHEIRQLGTGFLFFPYARHSRYDHSIGVAGWTKLFLRSLSHEKEKEFFGTEFFKERVALVTAALFHDIGHGPWSHVSEVFSDYRGEDFEHEERAAELILDDDGRYDEVLYNWGDVRVTDILDKDIRKMAAKLIQGDPLPAGGGEEQWMGSLIKGPTDLDRADYLNRDAYFTSFATPLIFPCTWMNNIKLRNTAGNLAELVFKDVSIAESFVLGRELMYQNVYMMDEKLIMDELLARVFLDGLPKNKSLNDLLLKNDEEIINELDHRRKLVKKFGNFRKTRQTYKPILKESFAELSVQIRDNLEFLFDHRSDLIEVEEEIYNSCKLQVSFDPKDFIIVIASWGPPKIREAKVEQNGSPEPLDRVSSLLQETSTTTYVEERSKFLIALDETSVDKKKEKKALIEATKEHLSEAHYF